MQSEPSWAGGVIPRLFVILAALVLWGGIARAEQFEILDYPEPKAGRASWYGPGFAGRKTASGERFNPEELTGAHRTLPLGTKVRVTNLHNGRSVLVRINDRGPFIRHRDIDLSAGAARELQMLGRGVASVLIQPL
jgi:rare lipoprotein A (peptidoglycan hydrolase)